MPRLSKRSGEPEAAADVLEVIHHEIPETAAGAGASAIPQPRSSDADSAPVEDIAVIPAVMPTAAMSTEAMAGMTTAPGMATKPAGTGMTWRAMLRAVAIAETAGLLTLLVAATLYGMDFFAPAAVAMILFAGAVVWLPRMSKSGAVYSLVVCSLTLLLFGGAMFAWTGFLYPTSWFEMTFATMTVLVPIAGIVAAIATLRHRDGTDAAKTPARISAAVCAALVVVGLVGTATADSAAILPGDVTLTAQNFAFEQTTLTANPGDVAIYFDNTDLFAHNVAIEGHGKSADAPGRQAVRHVFRDLAAGTYAYFCAIHTDMKGTLTVT